MTVQIKACFNRVIPQDGVYRVDVDIIDVVNIDFDVLVFDAETNEFSRVASVFDMEMLPTVASVTCPYYRGRGAKVSFNNLRDATSFETITRSRLKILAVAWNTVVEAFDGKVIVDIDSTVTV